MAILRLKPVIVSEHTLEVTYDHTRYGLGGGQWCIHYDNADHPDRSYHVFARPHTTAEHAVLSYHDAIGDIHANLLLDGAADADMTALFAGLARNPIAFRSLVDEACLPRAVNA